MGEEMLFGSSQFSYFAIIGDIRASREMAERGLIQKKLRSVLDMVNERFGEDIAAGFTVTLGDEFQGLLSRGENIPEMIGMIERGMDPIRLRFGIGIGEITTEIDRERAIGADGPAFYAARTAILFLKNNENKNRVPLSDVRVESEKGNREYLALINSVFSLITAIKATWTDRRREIIWDMLEHRDNQNDVAERFHIKQPSVQKTLSKGYYYTYMEALDTIGASLRGIMSSEDPK
ncbi:MAG: SatD family protein [Oscillospiraceae bacterium]|nr:SatD family protein [Oscillospiraceae bacterium]